MTLETIAKSIGDLDVKLSRKIEKLGVEIEDLALSTAKGFKSVDLKFSDLENKLNAKIDYVERSLSGKLDGVDRRIDDLVVTKSQRSDMAKLNDRLSLVESKVGIKS